jgi:hypothetical protein
MTQSPQFALDRSMRRIDADGHLHVEMSNISKANVCEYFGREIPGGVERGLDPNKLYPLYRDPAELKAAAPTFAGKPLLMRHQPITADAPAKELWVGTVGTDVRYEHPYLRAPLSVWTQEAIDAICADPDDPESLRELSPGYRYTVDWSPGTTPEGVAFVGRMRNIMCNHLAIVHEGRTGPDVFVADEAPKGFSKMKFPRVLAALAAILPALKHSDAVALDEALAADAFKPAEDAMSAEDMKAALDAFCTKSGKAMDALTDEDKAEAYKTAAKDKAVCAKNSPHASSGSEKPAPAMDEAVVTQRVTDAVAAALKDTVPKADADKLATDAAVAARAEVHALYTARKDVEATVGVVALDSAEAVYRFALDHLKVDHKETPAAALVALYTASAKAAPAIAADAAVAAAFDINSIYTFSSKG